jgi:dTDP-4-amino-4,6-dideoxygalactose transaminase
MSAFITDTKARLKDTVKKIARQTVGRLPPPASRFTGKLAIHGGAPVRDTRFRPWPTVHDDSSRIWRGGLGSAMRRIFTTGVEGLPQPLAKEFARRWADYCGVKHCLLLPHGTDALRLAIAAVFDHDGLDYGGEIIVPNFSFIASATSVLDRRFSVALVDVDADTLNLDPRRVEEAIVPGKTVGIMPVHLFGQPCDMIALRAIALKHGLKIIEDSAQAHGAIHELGMTGSIGDAAGFSFQSHKNLTSGEGGALTTNDDEIFERAYMLHDAGRSRVEHERWQHLALGWNCRPSEYVAALLLERFKNFDELQQHRAKNLARLRALLDDIPCVAPLKDGPGIIRHGAHMFVFRYLPEHCGGVSLDDWLVIMSREGSPTWRGYACTMSNQPAMKKIAATRPAYIRKLDTPVSDAACKQVAYIPQQVFLGSDTDMEELAAIFRKVWKHHAR